MHIFPINPYKSDKLDLYGFILSCKVTFIRLIMLFFIFTHVPEIRVPV